MASLKALIDGEGESQIGLWGGHASGKTHLLNASADYARRRGVAMQIYDGAELCRCDDTGFEADGGCDVLAIDNLDAIAGDPGWETFFYRVVNRCREGGLRFLFAMRVRPGELQTLLPDFRSRLQWGLMLQLPGSDDEETREILRQRARLLGMRLSDEVLAYLMTHYRRDLAAQMAILRRLDETSLLQQRKVTIPLIKTALRESG